MPFQDMLQAHLSAAEITNLDTALTAIETVLNGKVTNLSPEERVKYGSINEQNKLLVNKVRDYHQSQPTLASPEINWTEFEADWQDRTNLEKRILRLQGILERMGDKKILHDFDCYQNALIDYDYAKYRAGTSGGAGFDTKVDELKQFFPNTGGGQSTTNTGGATPI